MANLYALLVGIDRYSPNSPVPSLRGCVTDITAVQQFLTERLQVPAVNIIRLENEEATRRAIISAWQTHLIKRTSPGDCVYFHYSGHGSQAPSSDPAEADGKDETLVAHDSRQPDQYDIADKELRQLIDEVATQGAEVVIFLDCCHSGSGTRSEVEVSVRRCQADTRIRPASLWLNGETPPTRLPAKTRSQPQQSDEHPPTNHLLIAACRDEEVANEYHLPESGVWCGATTWFYLQALRNYHAEMTWHEVYDQLYSQVRSIYPRQSPQLEGQGQRKLFGGLGQFVDAYLLVTETTGSATGEGELTVEKIKLNAGVPAGITAGSRLALFPPASTLTGEPIAFATIESASLDHAWARLDRPTVLATASRARLIAGGQVGLVHVVGVDESADQGLLRQSIEQTLVRAPARFLQVVALQDETATPSLRVFVEAGHYVIRDPAGAAVLADRAPVSQEGAAKIANQLEHLALYRNVRQLANRVTQARLRNSLRISDPVGIQSSRSDLARIGQRQSLRQPSGALLARNGQRILLEIVNQSQQTCYVTVLRLGADYSIRRIEPVEGATTTLRAGGQIDLRSKLEAPPITEEWGGLTQSVLFKIFVTAAPTSFDLLQMPALNQGNLHKTAEVRDDALLGDLLKAVRRTATRKLIPSVRDGVDQQWWVETVAIDIQPNREGERVGLQERGNEFRF